MQKNKTMYLLIVLTIVIVWGIYFFNRYNASQITNPITQDVAKVNNSEVPLPQYSYIKEWSLMYPKTAENIIITYQFNPRTKTTNNDIDSWINLKSSDFPGCDFGGISKFTKIPTEYDSPVNPNNVKKIDSYYYFYEYAPQEPCFKQGLNTPIAGPDLTLYKNEVSIGRKIFDSLQ